MRFPAVRIDTSSRMFHISGFVALALAITVILLTIKPMALTGDEPRYLMYAYSFLHHGRFALTLAEWAPLYQATTGDIPADLPVGGNGAVVMHGVYLPAVFAPIAIFGLAGLRFATLVAGLVGLYFLRRICCRVAGPGTALMATAVAGLSIPLLPYLHLFYMETFLFAMVAFTWDRLQTPNRALSGDLLTSLFILAIPFVHMRGAVVAAALYAMLLLIQWHAGQQRRAVGLVVLAGLALALLIGLNLFIYGVVTGPVNTARPPMPWEWFAVVSMQLFNVRHGLIAFGPVWLLGYAGLIAGALRGHRIAGQGLILAILAGLTGMGVNPGECWPARFWVLSIPMLAVGLAVTWDFSRSHLSRAIVVMLICLTLVNTWMFINVPNMLIENRQTTATYQRFFDKIGYFHPGLTLPVELSDTADTLAARNMAIASALLILMVCAGLRSRRSVAAIPAALLILAALDLTRVAAVPKTDYTLIKVADGLAVTFEKPMKWAYVQMGNNWETWFVAPNFPTFTATTTGQAGNAVQTPLDANQVISISCASAVTKVTVSANGGFAFEPALAARFAVYRSRSILRNMVAPMRGAC